MSKPIENLGGSDVAAFRTAIDPHVRAVLDPELDQLAALASDVQTLKYGSGLAITSLTATPSAPLERGASVNISLAWAISGAVTAQTLTDSVSGPLALSNVATDRAKTVIGVSSSRTFTLSATNAGAPGGADTKSRTVDVTFLPRRFWGTSDNAALTGAQIIALASSELSGGRARAGSSDGGGGDGDYLFYAYIAELGDPNLYRLYGYDETPVKTTVAVTTAAGLTANYTVLRSPNKLAGVVAWEVA